ncbi:MAG: hypothetical protein OJF49_001728 [Ktedonobacterales bacterium]|nr:MAG: hypothetical protein OJF49_001728 [Ktedonobacterales bacterium]
MPRATNTPFGLRILPRVTLNARQNCCSRSSHPAPATRGTPSFPYGRPGRSHVSWAAGYPACHPQRASSALPQHRAVLGPPWSVPAIATEEYTEHRDTMKHATLRRSPRATAAISAIGHRPQPAHSPT